MEKKVVYREKDFLSDISGVVSPTLIKRLDWVGNNVDNFTSSYRMYNAGEMFVQLPPFAVVTSITKLSYAYISDERYIVSVTFCDTLDMAKDYIEDKLINDPISLSVQVDLFAFNGKYFEKVPYSVGYYEKITSETNFTCGLEDVEKVFNFESTVKRKLIEIPVAYEIFDTEKNLFVDIPDFWEVYYGDKAGYNTEHESEVFYFKNLDTVLEEAVIMMLEHSDITQVTVENSWYTVLLTIDNKEELLKDIDDWCAALDALKSAVKVEITLNY